MGVLAKTMNNGKGRGVLAGLSSRGRKAIAATFGVAAATAAIAIAGLTASAATDGVALTDPSYPAGTTAVADPSTLDGYKTFPTGDKTTSYDTTEYAGRLWTDKTVIVPSSDGATVGTTATIGLSNSGRQLGSNPTTGEFQVDMTASGTFLTCVSALSSSLQTELVEPQPLDIVMVLDVSGSMKIFNGYSQVTSAPSSVRNDDPNDNYQDDRYFIYEDGVYKQIRATRTEGGVRYFCDVDDHDHERYYFTTDDALDGTRYDDTRDYYYAKLYRRNAEPSRITELKTATNDFLCTIAANNTALANAGYTTAAMSQVSMITFSGYYNSKDSWTNDSYAINNTDTQALGRDRPNRTNIVTPFTTYTTDGSAGTAAVSYATNIVDGFTADHATAADYGLKLAGQVFAGNVSLASDFAREYRAGTRDGVSLNPARSDAKKVVIFFTDGNPKHDKGSAPNDFSGQFAQYTIAAAEELKAEDVLIYTVAVIDGADPTDLTKNINIYLNGVSSNYTGASATNGQNNPVSGFVPPASNTWTVDTSTWEGSNKGYYMVVGGDTSISDAFAQIAADITSGGSGEATATGRDGNTSLTITDYLGDYMEFKGIDGILYGVDAKSTTFYAPGTQGAWHVQAQAQRDDRSATESVYTMNAVVPSSLLSARHEDGEGNVTVDNTNLNLITIQVTRSTDPKTGDTVTIKIPPELVPSLRYDVTQQMSGGSITTAVTRADADPIRIFYSVGPKADTLANVISQLEDQALRSANATNESDRQTSAYRDFIANAAAYGADGYYDLYSNRPTYEGYTVTQAPQGEAKVDMVLSQTNPYYFYVDEPLYVQKDGSYQKATTENYSATDTLYVRNRVWTVGQDVADPSTYVAWTGESAPEYAKTTDTALDASKTYYTLGSDGTTYTEVASPTADDLGTYYETTGNLIIPNGTAKTNATENTAPYTSVSFTKTENSTNTATTSLVTVFDGEAKDSTGAPTATQYLGNNGRLRIPIYGTLAVMKNFTAGEGFSLPTDPAPTATMTLSLRGADGNALTDDGVYLALIRDADGHPVDPSTHVVVTNAELAEFYVTDGSTFTLRHGETIKITNLPDKATYQVVEAGQPGYQGTVTNNDNTTNGPFVRGGDAQTTPAPSGGGA